ncbi:MAG: hypothetical protein EA409_02530 [Saprospirales bacterium]|nr:MAG: hypothetical protein EA409_02530 [Saprospirales bacterium]
MKWNAAVISTLLVFPGMASSLFGQTRTPIKSLISIEGRHLFVNQDNPLTIVAQQCKPVSSDQLSAYIHTGDAEKRALEITDISGYIFIRPDTIGTVEINISIGDTIETKTFRAGPYEAVGLFGSKTANSDEKFSVGHFRAQRGIIAKVVCCNIDARCKILGFRVIRISNRNLVERSVNIGGSFEEWTREIIDRAQSGDIYIFRQIRCRCSELTEPQRLDDMIFEIE